MGNKHGCCVYPGGRSSSHSSNRQKTNRKLLPLNCDFCNLTLWVSENTSHTTLNSETNLCDPTRKPHTSWYQNPIYVMTSQKTVNTIPESNVRPNSPCLSSHPKYQSYQDPLATKSQGHSGVGSKDHHKDEKDTDDPASNLPHISEREPDDLDQDPSLHPTAGPLFVLRSNQASENGIILKKSQNYCDEINSMKKSSSCSTIYVDDSTVSQPNHKNTIKCVVLAIYYHIKYRTSNRSIDIFDEKLHPLTSEKVHTDYKNNNPEHKTIYKFVRTLFSAAQLTPECAIITLVYLERLLTYADIDMTPATWKRIVLGAIILASKVWDDQAVWNVDYCQILRDIKVDDMNELERQYLDLIQFNTNVPASVYVKYYFALRTLAESKDLGCVCELLSKERAQKLEAMSRSYRDKFLECEKGEVNKKWNSLDNVSKRSVAILS